MDCLDMELIGALLESRLGKAEAERVRTHAARCERCRDLLAVGAEFEEATAQVPRRLMNRAVGLVAPERKPDATPGPSWRRARRSRTVSRRRRRRFRGSVQRSSSSALIAALLLLAAGLAYLAIPQRAALPRPAVNPGPRVLARVTRAPQGGRIIRGISGQPLAQGADVRSGDTIRGGSTRAEIRLSDGSIIDLAPDAIIRFGQDSTDPRRSLEHVAGDVFLTVAREGGAFTVQVAGGQVTVLGTEFLLSSRPNRSTLVAVAGGRVMAGNKSGRVELAAGQQSRIGEDVAPTPAEPANVAALTAWLRMPPSYAPPVIFSSNFEDGTTGGLGGRVVPGGATPESRYCVAPTWSGKYWVVFGGSYYGMEKPWIAGDCEIRFKFKADRGTVKIKVMSTDRRPDDHWVKYFKFKPGEWTEVVVRGTELHDERSPRNRKYLPLTAKLHGFHFLVRDRDNPDDDLGFRLDDLTIRDVTD